VAFELQPSFSVNVKRVIPSRADGEGPRNRSADQLAPARGRIMSSVVLAQASE